jgi:hypothetical protein
LVLMEGVDGASFSVLSDVVIGELAGCA